MELIYATAKVENQCESLNAAKKLFGGDAALANSLMARINALRQADTIKDIIVQPAFHFHKLIQLCVVFLVLLLRFEILWIIDR